MENNYLKLLHEVYHNGVEKQDRTGTGTRSVFGKQIRHKMSEGFPLLTTKKMPFNIIATELIWFLRGDTNIKFLVDNNCHIWDGDCFANYVRNFRKYVDSLPENGEAEFIINKDKFINKIKTDDEFAKKWGELGPIYGNQWRNWTKFEYNYDFICGDLSIDQIANLINDLKTNPDSRRLMVNAWNVADLDKMTLPPCHYGFQVYTRELNREERVDLYIKKYGYDGMDYGKYKETIPTRAISLMFNMRSNDVPLGLPFNIASYGLLLEILGKMVNMVPEELIASLGDAHIYKNQVEGVKEQLTRTPMKLPSLIIADDVNFNGSIDDFLETCNKDSFKLNGYESHPSIKMPLSN